ncbi:deoxyribose-phosphate aldolase [Flavonifractor sp. An100]|uniref:deoxyribose-phosphate aldolase n=1 Tax=Flavonifractor sp. An100 TaxID=1965538 RepID=UPI000B3ACB80|nr:deoxyribose-phosphate aldolase [Flavonifractor sp. An100]OUQ82244.1 deoxyribose-phosphate aldolase [Flavonifractor sp. An100]
MNKQEILSRVDHTLLTTTATWEQVKAICDEGMEFGTASVCIPPRYVKRAAEYVGNRLKVCTVIGFPNGYNTPEVKVFETEDAIRNGADEIDMVINLGLAKAGDWEGVLEEIKAVKASCKGRILKVIVEACQLTQEEKVAVCRVVSMSGADYIKTSTGFSTGGATVEDVALFRANIGPDVRIKAAGGIRTFQQAQAMLEAGADRIGASALVALARQDKGQ